MVIYLLMIKEGHMLHLLYPVISISMFDIKERMVSLDFFFYFPKCPCVLMSCVWSGLTNYARTS